MTPIRPLVVATTWGLLTLGAAACGRPVPVRQPDADRSLKVCADPNNLPFTNDRLEGFENRIAALIAADLHRPVEYTWWAQRRGFVRNTLNAGACDVILGVPSSFDLALTTRPYYRSSYVFLWRADRPWALGSLDDARLRRLRIGVQMIGDDFANAPPAHALTARGLIANVVGYSVYGDYREPNPPAAIVAAVARREIDAAIVWGPLAGYFATRQPAVLRLAPVSPQIDLPFLPFVFDISMAVRRGDTVLRDALDAEIDAHQTEIDRILTDYGVPRLAPEIGR
jgi:mxaJ protein